MLLIRNVLRVAWEVFRFGAGERSLFFWVIVVPVAVIASLGVVVAAAAPVIYPFL